MSGMWIGWLEFDILLGDIHALKQKRSVVRPIAAYVAGPTPESSRGLQRSDD